MLISALLSVPSIFEDARFASFMRRSGVRVMYPTGARSYSSKYLALEVSSSTWTL